MKLSEEKIDIIQKVIELEDEEKLDRIHELLSGEENLNHLSESERKSIERGLRDLDEGKKISYQEFKHLIRRLAKEMGIESKPFRELTDEEMALPGTKVSKEQFEDWLAKDDGEGVPAEEAFAHLKKELTAKRKGRKNGNRNS